MCYFCWCLLPLLELRPSNASHASFNTEPKTPTCNVHDATLAGSALMAIWQAKCPDQPKPYTTLPSALEGCKYLVLKLAANGYQVNFSCKFLCQRSMLSLVSNHCCCWHLLAQQVQAYLSTPAQFCVRHWEQALPLTCCIMHQAS